MNSSCQRKLILVGPFPPMIGGTATFLSGFAASIQEEGIDCFIINTFKGSSDKTLFELSKRLYLFIKIGIRIFFRNERLLHCHAVNSLNLIGLGIVLILARWSGKRIILTLHAGDLLTNLTKPSSIKKQIMCYCISLADSVTTMTRDLQSAIISLNVLNSKNVLFISNALPKLNCSISIDQIPSEISDFLKQHKPVVVCVGSLQPWYGIDVLIEAIYKLRSSFPMIGTIIVAYKTIDEPYRQELLRLIAKLDLRNEIHFAKELPSVISVVSLADVFVRPNNVDGDSLAIREAIKARVPVVASRVGFRPEGVTLFEPGNSSDLAGWIGKLLNDGKKDFLELALSRENKVGQENIEKFLDLYNETTFSEFTVRRVKRC